MELLRRFKCEPRRLPWVACDERDVGELDKAAGLDHVFVVGHGVLSVGGCAFVHELMSDGSLINEERENPNWGSSGGVG